MLQAYRQHTPSLSQDAGHSVLPLCFTYKIISEKIPLSTEKKEFMHDFSQKIGIIKILNRSAGNHRNSLFPKLPFPLSFPPAALFEMQEIRLPFRKFRFFPPRIKKAAGTGIPSAQPFIFAQSLKIHFDTRYPPHTERPASHRSESSGSIVRSDA